TCAAAPRSSSKPGRTPTGGALARKSASPGMRVRASPWPRRRHHDKGRHAMKSPVNPGRVEWSGENPGIYLKDASGNWQALAVFFRVVTSPLGRGAGVLVLGAPGDTANHPRAPNVCLTDNAPMMKWL